MHRQAMADGLRYAVRLGAAFCLLLVLTGAASGLQRGDGDHQAPAETHGFTAAFPSEPRVGATDILVRLVAIPQAQAQGSDWKMPWETKTKPRRSPPPRRRPRTTGPAPASYGNSNVCLELERRLVQEAQGNSSPQARLARIDQDLRKYTRLYRNAKRRLGRSKCFETFLFVKTLRQNRKCKRLNRQTEDAKERMRELQAQLQAGSNGSGRSRQDEIIAALARNRCGANYSREARRRNRQSNPFSSFFWQDNDGEAPAPSRRYGALPFATYRTLCVRLCDGYYFPVSFSTLPNHFQRDVNVCQSQCAAPADLYYYKNPGASVEQMVSATSQKPYTNLRTAWRYRKEYVPGCSCKQAEYDPAVDDPNRKAAAGGFSTRIQPKRDLLRR